MSHACPYTARARMGKWRFYEREHDSACLGANMVGEERRLFTEALRNGYVLCQ